MYVSSRDSGTRAFRQLKAREFHEMQWNENMIHKGRLVGEKSEKMNQIIHIFRVTDKGNGKNENQKPALIQDDHSTILAHDAFKQQFDAYVRDCEIPNANFARKFGLFTSDRSLPPFIRELPVAEDKAMDMVTASSTKGVSNSRRFHGPFTPQLWFDSGIDYRWKHRSH
ncbi:hypothetical protein CEK26_013018 [Fusarium fujikuroi]|uniref:Uncharacterized protein n=1 Tax=Fusarium fujikuroi TaxID=5127 RepID=A0A5Q3F660_FUSFU|nr:hypothetical protein CEK27_013031 [Fusarium fujikuroi]QGI86428.1 hypothetical protein CEK25_013157 [Fusarium fujikuroi]QGI99949.1 hypothetical protein CEK26_013018 [Fusarium fujikuroi]VTT76042.1 unnamed protein product [Fusarium fujikuroi]VZI14045.1 unnamed protein product [Fusarium fujikuroi]